ncbi:hypothetical protein [Jannaschia formosa]|uniref:hypothetical protein n=1 Tax=Jannaschia formosa TaxID=2259592 RepID=UPI000E1C2EEC|nr:hypothetical protein [Jannaschia formosa]TFL18175.1 hypothetical protein DR046_10505 [Jannaschia formosa]
MFLDRYSFRQIADPRAVREGWERLRNRRGPDFDRTLGQPMVREGLAALHDGDWDMIGAIYREQAADDRYLWIELMSALWPLRRPLPTGARRGPALTVAGGLLVGLAWRHGGTGPAHLPSGTQRAEMVDGLRHARLALEMARQADGPDVVALGFALRAAMGLSDHEGVAAQTDLLRATAEPCLAADLALLTAWEARWGGSQQDMWAVIRDRERQGPAWIALDMRGRLEDCVWHEHMSEEPGVAEAHRARREDPCYTAEMLQLQAGALRGLARDQPRARRLIAHNVIGASMACLVSWQLAAPHLEAIGPHLAEGAWAQVEDVSDPARALARLRRRAGLEPLAA